MKKSRRHYPKATDQDPVVGSVTIIQRRSGWMGIYEAKGLARLEIVGPNTLAVSFLRAFADRASVLPDGESRELTP